MFNLENIIRKNINNLKPYSSARSEHEGKNSILLDANESPFNSPFNRYPDPLQKQLKNIIIKQINQKYSLNFNINNLFLGNGSDEAIDLFFRAFCEPGKDNVISPSPSYGMYKVCADINNIEFRNALLKDNFELDVNAILKHTDKFTKLVFICYPNNPTANCFNRNDILLLMKSLDCIVIIDEAYIDFSDKKGFISELADYPNLVILRTFSKSRSLAGIRLGNALADEKIINILNKIKYPYNINILTQNFAIKTLSKYKETDYNKTILNIIEQRKKIESELIKYKFVLKVYKSDANFLLVKFSEHKKIYDYLITNGIIIRDRSSEALCENCLRITIGNKFENKMFIQTLNNYNKTLK